MSDHLRQLLQRADALTSPPGLDASALPDRIRRSARNRQRITACALGLAPLLAISLLLIPEASRAPQVEAHVDPWSLELSASLHERTARLLEQRMKQTTPRSNPTDAFLAQLQMQRNRAALVLLNDANRRIAAGDPLAAAALKRTSQLFPETPAAHDAARQLRELLKEQS